MFLNVVLNSASESKTMKHPVLQVFQSGAIEYKGTTFSTTKQVFPCFFMLQSALTKTFKVLIMGHLGVFWILRKIIVVNLKLKIKNEKIGEAPIEIEKAVEAEHRAIIEKAITEFHNPDLRNYIIDVRKKYDQIIDTLNIDEITKIGWNTDVQEQAQSIVEQFENWVTQNRNEALALQIFYGEPYRRRELTYRMIKELYDKLVLEQPKLIPFKIWDAYANVEDESDKDKLVKRLSRTEKPKQDLVLLVSVIRKALKIDDYLTAYDKTVDRNFQEWIFKKNAGQHNAFTEDQMQWLRMIKDYIANSFHLETEDFELNPFNAHGGLGKFYQLFGDKYMEIIDELNEVLVA